MYSYPSTYLRDIEIQQWEKLQELAREKGAPYIDRDITIVIDLRRRSWIAGICKLYHKGKYRIELHMIRNPWVRIDKLRPLKQKELDWAMDKAKELLKELEG